MDRAQEKRFRKMIDEALRNRYGKNGNSAWAHMSGNQRDDARMAAAAHLVLMQAESIADKMTLAEAQDILKCGAPLKEEG